MAAMRRLRGAGQRLVEAVARRLPPSIRQTIAEQVCFGDGPWSLMPEVARRCGVHSITVSGEYGIFHGSPSDRVILPEYARVGRWAHRTNTLLATFFGVAGGYYIDVGANIGLTTIPIAQNPRIQCLALEPDPTNFGHLAMNVNANCRHGNVAVKQVAVFSRRDTLSFELAPANFGDHRLRLSDAPGAENEHSWATITVNAMPLDELAGAWSAERLAVKIDTQGAEPFVYEGGRQTLSRAELVVSEWAPYWLARLGGDPAVVTDFVRDHFSTISIANGESGEAGPPEAARSAAEQLLTMARKYHDDPRWYVDFIARK
jgi:FkbM family methyltransferase